MTDHAYINNCCSYFEEACRAAWEKAGISSPHWQQTQERMNRELKALREDVCVRDVEDALRTVEKLVVQKEEEEIRAIRGIGQYRLVPSLRVFLVRQKFKTSAFTCTFLYKNDFWYE